MTELWKARPHQLELAEQGLAILREYGIVYYAMEERTGKSITAIVTCENSKAARVLILTKLKAMDEPGGWNDTLSKFMHLNSYTVANYHSAHKVKGPFDAVILDEPHAYISGYPKTSAIWAKVYKLVYGLPIIYLSATPHAQGRQLLYHQFKLSKWSPWKQFKNFYEWFEKYAIRDKAGNVKTKYIGPNRTAIDYAAVDNDKIAKDIDHLFITKTRKELGFEHEPQDKLHYLELADATKAVYNTIMDDNVLNFTVARTGREYTLVCDSPIKLRWSLHMLEGGGLKIGDEYIELGNTEKVDYIKRIWGDHEKLAIMYQYKVEKVKLERYFKKARLLQATSYAEGVDLSGYSDLIIYSQDFSTSKHTQRRARQANINRKEEIIVHYLLVKKAVSEQVYKTCSINKKNFVDSVFEKEHL